MPELAYIVAGSRTSVKVEFAPDPENPSEKTPLQVRVYNIVFITQVSLIYHRSLLHRHWSSP